MKGFIVDRTYRIIDKKAYVYLFGRLANGESFLTINIFRPYFYIKKGDLEKARKLATFDDEPVALTSMAGDQVHKIVLDMPRDVPTMRKAFEDQSITCYEADIRFTQRFCMERGIYATVDIHGEHKKGRYVNRIYEGPTLTAVEFTPTLSVLSLDIETSLDGKELYAISFAMGNKAVTLVKGKKKLQGAETFDEERPMLERIAKVFQEWDPDVVTGWNVIDFDLANLKPRFEKHKVPFVLGRAEWTSSLRLEKSFLKDSSADVAGRMVLDGIHLLKSSFIRLDDYKLETAAQHFLGEGKILKGEQRHEEIERLYNEDPQKLVEYNKKDVDLVLKILESAKLIELTVLRSMLTGLTMERVRGSIAAFDSVYIREMNREGMVAPSGTYVERGERITGGYVRESRPGIYEWILVLDFKSMYPSVMRTFNIDPVSFMPDCKQKKTSKEIIVAPNDACFRNGDGLLPRIIQRLWEERDQAKKRKDPVASAAIKVLMNSFFGVLASPNCRFFSLEMGNAITHFARNFIKLAAERIEKEGYGVIYGDTDSVFVESKASSKIEAEKVGRRLQESINAFYQEYVMKEYHRTNFMELEAEKIYRKFLMPRIRGGEAGAKKRYAGLLLKEGKEELDFTGLEFVRRDWTELAKRFQLGLLDKIFHEQEVTEFVKRFVEDLKSGKHDALLVYRKGVRKDLEEYTKTTPPHVKAARLLEAKGESVGSVVEYLLTTKGPEPAGHAEHPIDYEHYIEKQLRPIADAVLGFYGTSFDDLVSGTSQKTLFSY